MPKLVFLFIFLLLFIGCTEFVTDQFPEHQPKPVVNATLVADYPIRLNVSFSNKIDSLAMVYCDNAIVRMFENEQFAETLQSKGDGWYVSNLLVKENTTYTCEILVPGYDTIRVSTFISPKANIKEIKHINIAGVDEEGKSFPALELKLNNLSTSTSYYELVIHFFNKPYENNVILESITDPVILNEGLPITLFSNELIHDSIYTMHLGYTTNSAVRSNGGPWRDKLFPLVIQLRSVSYDYYRFKKSTYLYENGRWGDGIVTPMGNSSLYTNIENGYGIFCGYSAVQSDTIYPKTEGYYD